MFVLSNCGINYYYIRKIFIINNFFIFILTPRNLSTINQKPNTQKKRGRRAFTSNYNPRGRTTNKNYIFQNNFLPSRFCIIEELLFSGRLPMNDTRLIMYNYCINSSKQQIILLIRWTRRLLTSVVILFYSAIV